MTKRALRKKKLPVELVTLSPVQTKCLKAAAAHAKAFKELDVPERFATAYGLGYSLPTALSLEKLGLLEGKELNRKTTSVMPLERGRMRVFSITERGAKWMENHNSNIGGDDGEQSRRDGEGARQT